jgi:hypothetical protein
MATGNLKCYKDKDKFIEMKKPTALHNTIVHQQLNQTKLNNLSLNFRSIYLLIQKKKKTIIET